jgi:hypothetical protein
MTPAPIAETAVKHANDYFWRPGMPLRPAPPRIRFEDIWTHTRREAIAPWVCDWQEVPVPTERTKLFMDHEWQGDEAMDALVARFREIGMIKGRKMFEQALSQGIGAVADPPKELVAVFEQVDNLPTWHDSATVEQGRALWNNASYAGKLGMAIGDFFGTFVGDEVAHATGQTHRFVNDFARRGLETNTWFWHVSMKNGLERFATPFKNTVRLRLMHAQARAGLRRAWGDNPEVPGGFAGHGNPISACMVMTAAITFGLNPLLIDHQHGRKTTWENLDAVMAYWSYLAYLLGVPAELIPRDAREAIEIMDYVVAHAGGPSQWTDAQMGAALNGPNTRARVTRALTTPMLGVLAYYAGAPIVRALIEGTDMRGARFEPWIPFGWALVNASVLFRRCLDKLPGAQWRMQRRNSDIFFHSGVWVANMFAARKGLRGARYTHHDSTVDSTPDMPIPEPPPTRCPMGY